MQPFWCVADESSPWHPSSLPYQTAHLQALCLPLRPCNCLGHLQFDFSHFCVHSMNIRCTFLPRLFGALTLKPFLPPRDQTFTWDICELIAATLGRSRWMYPMASFFSALSECSFTSPSPTPPAPHLSGTTAIWFQPLLCAIGEYFFPALLERLLSSPFCPL
jgi:hypothetical protein